MTNSGFYRSSECHWHLPQKYYMTTPKLCQSFKLNLAKDGRIYELILFSFNFSRVISVTAELLSAEQDECNRPELGGGPQPMEILAAGKIMNKPSPELTFLRRSFNTSVNIISSEGGGTLREYPISEEFLTCEYKKIDLQRRYELWIVTEGFNLNFDFASPINLHTCKYNMYLCCAVLARA